MLKNLIFNFAALDPATCGGVAAVCRGLARHVPALLPQTNTLVLTGKEGWEDSFPLPPGLPGLSLRGQSKRKAAMSVEAALVPEIPRWNSWARWRLLTIKASGGGFLKRHQTNTVVHCPYQFVHPLPPAAWNLPYVMNLCDIQHEHFPEFFTPQELAFRRSQYLASARHAMAVCVVDAWTKRDILAHLPIPEDKVFIAPIGPTWADPKPLSAQEETGVRQTYRLPSAFIYYPAQTWPHKNHSRLLSALASLKTQRNLRVDLVCTGHLNHHHRQLVAEAESLGIGNQVQFLGLIPGTHVQALFHLARAVVIPTLFEGGAGIPVLEAMAMGKALAASSSCGIPDAVGDTALLFDPTSVEDMAASIARLWEDEDLRQTLGARAQARSRPWTWEKAAQGHADIYREALARWNAQPGAHR